MLKLSRRHLIGSFIVLALFLLPLLATSLSAHGEEVGGEEGLLIVPFVNGSQSVDGLVDEAEYPEIGHLELSDLGLTVMFKHNGSHMIVGLVFDDTGFGGIGLRVVGLGGHEESEGDAGEAEFLFFLASVISGSVHYSVLIGDSEFSDIHANVTDDVSFTVLGGEDSSGTRLEFAIPLFSGDEGEGSEGNHESISDLLPRVGYLFQFVAIFSSSDSISTTGVTSSDVFGGYVLREGENPQDILESFERKPDASNVVLIPLLLILAIGVVVWRYYRVIS